MAATITLVSFLSQFLERHQKLPSQSFCWILGSGASVQSGIPSGGELAKRWIKELYERGDCPHIPIEEWATAKNLGIKNFNFKNASNFYPFIYQRRFLNYKELGYAFLEQEMEKSEPSYGYTVLSQLMTGTRHKIAITTNFDNLIADAISMYTRAKPLICGHELLTGFIRPGLNRPVIAKIHRDLLLEPKSSPEEIEQLPEEWENALNRIFENNTPIVIGYGGNDGSLMGYLKKASPIKGGIFWCHRAEHEPSQSIQKVVERHNGCLVPIDGFDEMMVRFATKLELQSPLSDLKISHQIRVDNLTKQLTDLEFTLKKKEESEKQLQAFRLKMRPWNKLTDGLGEMAGLLLLNQQIQGEPNLEKREAIFRSAAPKRDGSAWFCHVFADFLWKSRGNLKEANEFFQKALEIEPDSTTTKSAYDEFLKLYPQLEN